MAFDMMDFLANKVYAYMDDYDKASWSAYEALKVVHDVQKHDGIKLNVHEVYEIIAEMIAQDEEE